MKLPAGDGTELRLLEPRHAEGLFALTEANRDHLAKWLSWVDSTRSVEDTREFIRRSLHDLAEGRVHSFGVWDGGELVGTVGLTVEPVDGYGEVGYWIAEDAQGRGVMTRAVRALLDFAFSELQLPRIEIRTDPENQRSRALPERLGFTLEATVPARSRRPDGSRTDQCLYGLLREAWAPSSGRVDQ